MLEVEEITVRYNGALAVSGVSLKVERGQAFALLGRNGAVKTTILRSIAGVLILNSGSIRMDGHRIRPPSSRVARAGVRFVPESDNVFGDMTVIENLEASVVRVDRRRRRQRVDWALETFPLLQPLRTRRADRLSGGERQSLAVACALASAPKLLLLDEPSLGLSPKMATSLMTSIAAVCKEFSMTAILAEQNILLAGLLCKTGCWLETGTVSVVGDLQSIAESVKAEVSNAKSNVR